MNGRLVLFSGAGASVASGLTTFRGGNGLWDGHNIDVVCNYHSYRRHFETVHRFYNERRAKMASAAPNPIHYACAEWSGRYETVNLTQNVDRLFERAGCRDVVHLHGVIDEMKCEACGLVFELDRLDWEPGVDRCPRQRCGSKKAVKPNVVFFHEDAPAYATLYRTMKDLRRDDVVVVIGTSEEVINISAHLHGRPGYKLNVNPEASLSGAFNNQFTLPAEQVIDDIDRVLRERLG